MKTSRGVDQMIKNGAKILGITEAELIEKAVSDYLSMAEIYSIKEDSLTGDPDEEPAAYNF